MASTREHGVTCSRNWGEYYTFLKTFAALWGLCVPLQGGWNGQLAYHLLSSVCWQPASPGDLAYRQQMKQIGNYSVISRPDWCSATGLRFFVFFYSCFFFLKLLSLPYLLDLLVYTSHLSKFPGVCLVIIFQPFAFISWHVKLYTTWKMKWGTMRLMLCGWVKSKCQMHSVHDT